jgi:hypothetical protein
MSGFSEGSPENARNSCLTAQAGVPVLGKEAKVEHSPREPSRTLDELLSPLRGGPEVAALYSLVASTGAWYCASSAAARSPAGWGLTLTRGWWILLPGTTVAASLRGRLDAGTFPIEPGDAFEPLHRPLRRPPVSRRVRSRRLRGGERHRNAHPCGEVAASRPSPRRAVQRL